MILEFEKPKDIPETSLRNAAEAFNEFYFVKSDTISFYGFEEMEPLIRNCLSSIIRNGVMRTTLDKRSELEYKGFVLFGNDYCDTNTSIINLNKGKGFLIECRVNGINSEEDDMFIGQIALVDKSKIKKFNQINSVLADLHCIRDSSLTLLTTHANKIKYKTLSDNVLREVEINRSIMIHNKVYLILVNRIDPIILTQ